MRSLAPAVLLVLTAAPLIAAPASLDTVDTAADVILTGVGADLDGSLSISGMSIDTSTMFTPLRGRAFFGGITGLNDVSGDLATEDVSVETGGATDFGASLWIAQGDDVLRRSADGWSRGAAPARLDALHAFDAQRLVGVGEGGVAGVSTDGGASWTAVPTGTDVDLTDMTWLNDSDGYAWGTTFTTTGGFDEEEERFAEAGVVLRSTDAGASWSVVTERNGEVVGPVHFLPGGQTGWMATSTIEPTGSAADASLFRTTDGGATWSSIALPASIGTVDGGFSQEDITIGYVGSMWWDNEFQGRLFTVAHLFDATASDSNGGGSSDAAGWKIVELVTHDGGNQWIYDDLGTIEVEFSFDGVQADHDGAVTAGTALSWSRHVLLGSEGRVWFTTEWGKDPDHERAGEDTGTGDGDGTGDDGRGGADRGGESTDSGGSGCAAAPMGVVGWWALIALRRRRSSSNS